MKNLLVIAIFLSLLSCNGSKNERTAKAATPPPVVQSPELTDKGTHHIYLDSTSNFRELPNLQLSRIQGKEHLSFFSSETGSIKIHDLTTGELINSIQLKTQGPNSVKYSLVINYFIHRLDSIFIDTYRFPYYLINDKGEVLKTIGKTSDDQQVALGAGSYYANSEIHGSVRMPFKGSPKETKYSRASLKLQSKIEVTKTIENQWFIDNYDEILTYRKQREKRGQLLDNVPRHFAIAGDSMFATTPLSDSVRIFRNGQRIGSVYAGLTNSTLASFDEYINFVQTKQTEGMLRMSYEMNRPPYFSNTLISPDGAYLYRVLIKSTAAEYNELARQELPEVKEAVLLAVDLRTNSIEILPLPVNEIDIGIYRFPVFASQQGVHFRVKDQSDENQVDFRVFGMTGS